MLSLNRRDQTMIVDKDGVECTCDTRFEVINNRITEWYKAWRWISLTYAQGIFACIVVALHCCKRSFSNTTQQGLRFPFFKFYIVSEPASNFVCMIYLSPLEQSLFLDCEDHTLPGLIAVRWDECSFSDKIVLDLPQRACCDIKCQIPSFSLRRSEDLGARPEYFIVRAICDLSRSESIFRPTPKHIADLCTHICLAEPLLSGDANTVRKA